MTEGTWVNIGGPRGEIFDLRVPTELPTFVEVPASCEIGETNLEPATEALLLHRGIELLALERPLLAVLELPSETERLYLEDDETFDRWLPDLDTVSQASSFNMFFFP